MSLWKYSFELVTRELDLAKKKQQALDDLFASNRISQSTFDYLAKELTEAVTDLEDHLKTLMDKMTARARELEKQVSILELFLASLEIHHVAGDVDDETYGKQNSAILLGLEATKQELNSIKSSLSKVVVEAAEVPVAPTAVAEPAIPEATGATEPTEVEEEEEPQAEEAPTYAPVESTEPSLVVPTETTATEPVESEVPSLVSPSEEPSEQPSAEIETNFGY